LEIKIAIENHVVLWVNTNVLEEHAASIFMADPEDARKMFLQNNGIYMQDYTMSHNLKNR
jgi:hypothetical protein